MRIIVFKYGSLLPTETFVRGHFEHIAGGFEDFMHLDKWNTPKLGGEILWRSDIVGRAWRKVLLKMGCDRGELHRRAFAWGLREHKASVVLAEFGVSGVQILEPCRNLHIPLVVHFHGTDVNRRSILEKHACGYEAVFRYAARLVAVSEDMKAKLAEMTADPDKISVIPCGATIPVELRTDGQGDDEYRIISVARMAEVKAPHLTMLAYQRYLCKGGTGRLHMVGDGPLLPTCKSLAKGLGIDGRVTFHGGLEHAKVLELLERCHMYVQHSVVASDGDCEGMPVSIMEAGGYGLPIVVTRHGGIPEFVEHGKNGYLVDEYDVEGMGDYMYEMWRNREKARLMGRAAYGKARKNFDVRRQAEKLKRLILSTLGNS